MDNFTEKMKGLLDSGAPKILFNILGIRISTIVFTTWIIMAIIFSTVFVVTRKLEYMPKTKKQIAVEGIVQFFINFAIDIVGKKGKDLAGIFGSIFIIIFSMNFIWFIPILHPPTAAYSTTSALAIIGILYSQYMIIEKKGFAGYLKSFLKPLHFMIFFNIIDLFTRPLALSIRLFGNLFTGGILLGVVYAAMPFLLPLPFHGIELLTGTIQAYIFSLLIGIYTSEGLE